MKKNKSWIYLPIETKVRELHGKMFLSLVAAEKGFDVVIGSRNGIYPRLSFLPKGIMFGFGLSENFSKNYKKFQDQGLKVVTWDEEGLVTLREDLYLHHRVSEKTMNFIETFFCWGEKHASVIKKISAKTKCEVFVTGNPRFDLLRPEYKNIFNEDAEKIKKKYGKIILINTNFGHANHYLGDDFSINSIRQRGWMDNPDDEKYFLRLMDWQKEMFYKFQEAIPDLSRKFKNHTIIVRPHPSENQDVWKNIAKKFTNVLVIHSGNVIPWLISADIIMHNGCTTAIEACLLGAKVVSYRPFIIEDLETKLPNEISMQTYNKEDLLATIEKMISEKCDSAKASREKCLGFYVSGITGKTSSEMIIDKVEEIENARNSRRINKIGLLFFNIAIFVLRVTRKLFLRQRESINEIYQKHKMPKLMKTEIIKIVNDFINVNKNFSNLKVEQIGEECFHIYDNK